MALTANWYFELAVVGGQNFSARGAERSEVFLVFNGEVAAGATKLVDLLSATATGKVSVLVLNPSKLSNKVTFSFTDPAAAQPPKSFELAAPVVLIGASVVELLPSAPLKLWLKNAGADPVGVEILIGRDPTP